MHIHKIGSNLTATLSLNKFNVLLKWLFPLFYSAICALVYCRIPLLVWYI